MQATVKDQYRRLKGDLLEQVKLRKKLEERNKIEFFGIVDEGLALRHATCCKIGKGPNPIQAKLLHAWADLTYKVFTLTGANRIGKCVCFQALIETPDGEIAIGELYKKGKPFDVYAWDGEKKVIAKAGAPFKKNGLHKCYQIEMNDGRIIEAADHHKILTSHGWISVEQLQASFDNRQATNSGLSPSTHISDDNHLNQKQLNFQDDCFDYFYQYGGQLLSCPDNALIFSPLQDGVLKYNYLLFCLDGQVHKYTNNLSRVPFRLSIRDVLHLNEGQFSEFLSHIFDKILSFFSVESPLFQKLSNVEVSGTQLNPLIAQHQSDVSCSHSTPLKIIGNNDIKYIKSISSRQEVYDFEVKKYHNYFAGGMIHHNTTILTIIGFAVMFGYWPWDNRKIIFPHTRPRKVRYVGQDWEEHIKTVVQPCLDHWWPADRPVDKKKNNQGIDATWTDKKTGSELIIMSNKQDPGTHEGWEGDLVIYDEPPKREIRIANSRGLMDRQGRELLGATLLKEAWIHREVIKALDKNGNPDASVFNVTAEIDVNIGFGLTQEGVDDFARKLKPDEIEARLRGKPAYLSGLIFPKFNRQTHIKERFNNGIPLDWITDIAIDWHPSKGWAIQFVATDPINRKWVHDEIFEKNNYKYIAEEIIRRIKRQQLRVENILMDPLAKSGSQADLEEETVFDKLSNLLYQYGYTLTTASKDQNSGIDLINEFLMTESEEPALFVFRDCPITIQHLEDWMWKEGKPAAEGEDMCENLYRIMLLNTQWFSHTARYTSKAKKTTWKTV